LEAVFHTPKGAIVARKRPTVSDVAQIPADLDVSPTVRGTADGAIGLSHAQARALRRCTPLTADDFKTYRHARGASDESARAESRSRPGLPSSRASQIAMGSGRPEGEADRVDG
jgi:hypothetical protein